MVDQMAANYRTRRRKHAASSTLRSCRPDAPSSGCAPASASRPTARRGVATTGSPVGSNISASVAPGGADHNTQDHLLQAT